MEKIKVKGIKNRGDVVFIPFPFTKKVTSLKCGVFYHDRGDDATRLSHGEFSYSHRKQGLFVCMHEKINRPVFFFQFIERVDIKISTIDKLKRRSAPASCLYAGKARKTKQKITWGTSSPRCGDVERQLTIPSKLGLIHSEGNTFLLNNRVIATVENENIVPKIDVTTKTGDYLYRRILSIFEMDTVFDRGNEYKIKDGIIKKNGEQIGFTDTHGIRFNSKATEDDKKLVHRMLNYDETLIKGSTKKREIQMSLA